MLPFHRISNIRQIMGDTTHYDVGDDIDLDSPHPLKKVSQTQLSTKPNLSLKMTVMRRRIMTLRTLRSVMSYEEWFKDVLKSDEMEVEDSEGATFTCHVLLNWKVTRPSLMSDTCHLAYLLSPLPVVQKHISLNMSLEDKIAERIIFTTFYCQSYCRSREG